MGIRTWWKHRQRVRVSRRPEWRGKVIREGFCEEVHFGDGKLGLVIDGHHYNAVMTDFTNPKTRNCERRHVKFRSWMHTWAPSEFTSGGVYFEAQIVETLRPAPLHTEGKE